jgi:predicted nucleotidyltransferase component of viral defense system
LSGRVHKKIGIDLLKNHSNEISSVERMVKLILEEKTANDFTTIAIRNIERISEIKEYHGIRVNLVGHINKTRTPFSIDIGVGDTIVPSAIKRTIPAILEDFNKPTILTYSLESTVSEKFDAIMRFMETTGRMKDFYDIYYLAVSFEFEGRKLQEAIHETLSQRGTPYESDSVIVIQRLINNNEIINRWENFCNKILKYELTLKNVVGLIIKFIDPPFQAMINEDEFFKRWNPNEKQYE